MGIAFCILLSSFSNFFTFYMKKDVKVSKGI
jgi:hypothetical protein